jgi:hypothetical protein
MNKIMQQIASTLDGLRCSNELKQTENFSTQLPKRRNIVRIIEEKMTSTSYKQPTNHASKSHVLQQITIKV